MSEFKKQLQLFKQYGEAILETIPEDTKDKDDSRTRNVTNNQIMELNNLLFGLSANEKIIEDLINPKTATMGNLKADIKYFSEKVASNEAQKDAVRKMMGMNNILVIQGPPGTGKTSVITEMILQILKKNKNAKILITSSAHEAVNNVMDKLIENDFTNIARIRNTEDAESKYKDMDCDFIVDSYLKDLNHKNHKIYNEISDYVKEKSYNLMHSMIMSKSVIGVTINAIHGCKFKYTDQFDYVFVDEVGKSPLLEIISVIPHAKKLILIGDPLQLPPVLTDYSKVSGFNKKDYDYLLMHPYINYLFDNINPSCRAFLNQQFRMVQPIGSYISETYYQGHLNNGERKITNDALNIITYEVGNNKAPKTKKLINEEEITILQNLLNRININGKKLAIISFYSDQVELLKKTLNFGDNPNIKIGTVDAFQGKDADIVFLLCVRNYGKPTSFIQKPNRLNVAISRAKEQMWIIGNIEYLSQVEYLRRYINFNKHYGNRVVKCNIYEYKNGSIIKYQNKKE